MVNRHGLPQHLFLTVSHLVYYHVLPIYLAFSQCRLHPAMTRIITENGPRTWTTASLPSYAFASSVPSSCYVLFLTHLSNSSHPLKLSPVTPAEYSSAFARQVLCSLFCIPLAFSIYPHVWLFAFKVTWELLERNLYRREFWRIYIELNLSYLPAFFDELTPLSLSTTTMLWTLVYYALSIGHSMLHTLSLQSLRQKWIFDPHFTVGLIQDCLAPQSLLLLLCNTASLVPDGLRSVPLGTLHVYIIIIFHSKINLPGSYSVHIPNQRRWVLFAQGHL